MEAATQRTLPRPESLALVRPEFPAPENCAVPCRFSLGRGRTLSRRVRKRSYRSRINSEQRSARRGTAENAGRHGAQRSNALRGSAPAVALLAPSAELANDFASPAASAVRTSVRSPLPCEI